MSNAAAALPPMRELNVSNHLLGDRAALQAAWERDGYWYFKKVLDPEVMGRMRAVWMEFLHRSGLVDLEIGRAHV